MSGRMTLSELEFLRLLPEFMRSDKAVQGLSVGLDIIIPQAAESVKKLSTWDQIDKLSEQELDDLAWELNILWYDANASVAVKREIVKNSDKVFRHLGTKWAVENVINTYFGEGYISEWWEYGGEPGRFRVYSTNPSLTQERITEFLHLLNKVKRASAKLDGVYIEITCQMPLAAGVVVHEYGAETYAIGANPI